MTAVEKTEELFPVDGENLLTLEEWVDEFHANACCPDAIVAARRLCGCGGSAGIPAHASRILVRALTPDL